MALLSSKSKYAGNIFLMVSRNYKQQLIPCPNSFTQQYIWKLHLSLLSSSAAVTVNYKGEQYYYHNNNTFTLKETTQKSQNHFKLNSLRLFHTTNNIWNQNQKPQTMDTRDDDASTSTSTSSATTESRTGTGQQPQAQLSRQAKLKQAVKDYGSTVLVFHITMSLCSLGMFYLLVSSGLDMVGLLEKIGVGEQILQSKITQGASTFVVAYAVHKVFAPVRIGITLTATPLIVKKLRTMGILKMPKIKK